MKEIERILRLDHAGEYGAINIYSAQLLIARLFYKDIVSKLEEMLSHEKEHFNTFNNLLVARSIRPFYAIKFWAVGGFALGLSTAIITALLRSKGTENGKPFEHKLRFSDVYVRTQSGWRYAFGQASLKLPKE